MTVRFVLRSKQSMEVFDGANLLAGGGGFVVYRITVEHAAESELKIVADGVPSKIINLASPSKSLDIAIRKNLFLEALGSTGVIAGSYDLISSNPSMGR